jgi:hypothetical protein
VNGLDSAPAGDLPFVATLNSRWCFWWRGWQRLSVEKVMAVVVSMSVSR